MEGTTRITLELEVAAQRLIQQYMLNNNDIEEQVKAGIDKAFQSIDIEAEIEESVRTCIYKAIKESTDWGKISRTVATATEEMVDAYIKKSISKFKADFTDTNEE